MVFKVTFSNGDSSWVEEIEADSELRLYAILDGTCEDVDKIEKKLISGKPRAINSSSE